MSKITTALSLLFSGSFGLFRLRLRIYVRSRRLRRASLTSFVHRVYGFAFVCQPSLPDSAEVFLTGEVDRAELALLRDWLEPGDAFLDVGANLGLYAFCAHARLRGRGAILAVEAAPALARHLVDSARLLGADEIAVEQAAIGDETGATTFYIAVAGQSTAEQSLHPDPTLASHYAPLRVPLETLSVLIKRHPACARPAAVKLDIEGAEPRALRGAPPAWFTPSGPLWIVEINLKALARGGFTTEDIVNHFPSAIFDRWLVPHFATTGPRELPFRPLADHEDFSDALYYNLIAIPRAPSSATRRHRMIGRIPRA